MKKFAVLLLTLALFCALAIPSFAATTIGKNESSSANVKGTYVAGGTAAIVYSVDIKWGCMEFTYTTASQGTWNPQTHQYDGATTAGWSYADGANEVEVTNHSNTDVTAILTYTPNTEYGIDGEFDKSQLDLEAATVNSAFSDAPKGIAKLSLGGALASGVQNAVIGTVTVKLGNN